MNQGTYPIPFEGACLQLSPLTAGIKQAFCRWLKPRLIAEARDTLPTAEYLAFRDGVIAGSVVWWTTTPSVAVASSFNSPDGAANLHLNRLMFGESLREPGQSAYWSDGKLQAYLDANQQEDSPYRLAFDLAWDSADPKALRPTPISAGPTDTTGSSTS